MTYNAKTPIWVWGIIVCFALIEPLTHFWLAYGLGNDVAHSGFHIGDTPFFTTDMEIFSNGFYSPYLACDTETGRQNFSLFALPHHWLYASVGWLGRLVGLAPFITLGLANGLGAAFFLAMVWRFLRCVAPQRAALAFALFTLSGGLGGVAWLMSLAWGAHSTAGFEAWFHRFARYELIEGPFLSPALILPRLYYTLPLGLGFASLVAFIRSMSNDLPLPGKRAVVLQFLTAYLNARVGLLLWGVAACFILVQPRLAAKQKFRYIAYFFIPTLIATLLMRTAFGMNVTGAENFSELLRRCAWFGSLLTATFWLWPPVLLALWRHLGRLHWSGRLLLGWGLGYGVAFAGLYVAHQVWYGNWLAGGETAAAIAISDWALLGIIPGSLVLFRKGDRTPFAAAESWVALWFLGLACLSISAFGQGWFLRLMPERCLIVLGVPMALLAAEGLQMMGKRLPRLTRGYVGTIIVFGLCSLGVSTLCFQGPLGHVPGVSPFGWAHSEVVLPEDVALIDRIDGGTALAPASEPPLMGDVVVVRRPNARTVFGQPSLEFSDVNMLQMARDVQEFFDPGTNEITRFIFVTSWCVDYVYCPATRPVAPEVIEQFRKSIWLEPVDAEGDALLFRVVIPEELRDYV